MIWAVKKIVALFLAKLLWFTLSDDDTACLSSQFNFFFAENGRNLRFHNFLRTSCTCLN